MAKVYSHSESRAKGSVGMTTYRYVRGRVIQSQKIAPWDPAIDQVGNATRWNPRTALMGIISLWCSAHAQSLINSFNRTKNGSQRNYFMKKNYPALAEAFASLAVAYADSRIAPTLAEIESALGTYATAHPNTIYRIKKSGYDIVFLAGAWDDADDPAAPASVSSMEATLNGSYEMTSVAIVGSNLSQSVKLYLAGALVDGVLSIAAGNESATFTPSTAPLIMGSQQLAAKVGSRVLKTITVEGDPAQSFNLSLSVTPAGGGTVTGAGTYREGTQVEISATAAQGYNFLRWSDGNTNATRTVTVNADMSLQAVFGVPGTLVKLNIDPNGESAQAATLDGVAAVYTGGMYQGELSGNGQHTITVTKKPGETFYATVFNVASAATGKLTIESQSKDGDVATCVVNIPNIAEVADCTILTYGINEEL